MNVICREGEVRMDKYYAKEEAKYRKELNQGSIGTLIVFGSMCAAVVSAMLVLGCSQKICKKLRGVMKR